MFLIGRARYSEVNTAFAALFGCLRTTKPGCGRDSGDDYVINGARIWTTGLNIASWLFVVARTARDPAKMSHGLTVFLIPKDTPGITCNKIEKLGSKFLQSYKVSCQNVRVPKSSVIGTEGR